MEFESFEQALQICVTAEQGSEEQDLALIYCIEHAPADLKDKIKEGLANFQKRQKDNHDDGCDGKHD
jgi:hypothetical protein